MSETIVVTGIGGDISYHSLKRDDIELGHVVTGKDSNNPTIGKLIDLEVKLDKEKRRGFGSRLIIEAIRHLSGQGAHYVDVDVLSTNTAAIRLYEKLGFGETGREKAKNEVYIKMRRSTEI